MQDSEDKKRQQGNTEKSFAKKINKTEIQIENDEKSIMSPKFSKKLNRQKKQEKQDKNRFCEYSLKNEKKPKIKVSNFSTNNIRKKAKENYEKKTTPKAKMFQNEILKKLPASFTDRTKLKPKNLGLKELNKEAFQNLEKKQIFKLSNEEIEHCFQKNKTNRDQIQTEKNSMSCQNNSYFKKKTLPQTEKILSLEIKDIQMVEMDRQPSTIIDLDSRDEPLSKYPFPSDRQLLNQGTALSFSNKKKDNDHLKFEVEIVNDIHQNQVYIYNPESEKPENIEQKIKSFREKGIQKNTMMTNEFTMNNITQTSKEISSKKISSKKMDKERQKPEILRDLNLPCLSNKIKENVRSSLSLKQLNQTLKQNDKLLDSSSRKKSGKTANLIHEFKGKKKIFLFEGSRDKMYFNPIKIRQMSPSLSLKRSLGEVEQSKSQVISYSQVFKEHSLLDQASMTPQNLSQFHLLPSNLPKQFQKSFQNLSKSSLNPAPFSSKNKVHQKSCINSKSIINSRSVLIDSQSIGYKDHSFDKSMNKNSTLLLAQRNKSELFDKQREKVKRFMDKSLPSCSLFLRAKTMTEVAQKNLIASANKSHVKLQENTRKMAYKKVSISFDDHQLPIDSKKDNNEKSQKDDSVMNDAKNIKMKSVLNRISTQNLEIKMVTEISNQPSIQHFNEKTQSMSQNALYPTPINSTHLQTQNFNQNLCSRQSVSEETQVQEIQIYSRSRPESESITLNSSTPQKAEKEEKKNTKKENFQIETQSDGINGIETRFSEYTPREIDSLIYNNFLSKNPNQKNKAGALNNINIPNLYNNRSFNETNIQEMHKERVSVSVSESNHNHEVIENLDKMYISTNAFNNSASNINHEEAHSKQPKSQDVAMDTFRGKSSDNNSAFPRSSKYLNQTPSNEDNDKKKEINRKEENGTSDHDKKEKSENNLFLYKECDVVQKLKEIEGPVENLGEQWTNEHVLHIKASKTQSIVLK